MVPIADHRSPSLDHVGYLLIFHLLVIQIMVQKQLKSLSNLGKSMTTDLIPRPTTNITTAPDLYQNLLRLDEDPNWATTVDVVSGLLNIIDKAMWSIGYVLVFLRFRAEYHTVETFQWNDKDIPDELHTFIREKYYVKMTDGRGQPFLLWHSVRFGEFWLLFGPGEIRVWERQKVSFEEVQFMDHLSTLEKELYTQLGGNRLYPYYRTGRVWPPEQQYQDVSWSWHYYVTTLSANELDLSGLATEKDWHRLSEQCYQRAKELTSDGTTGIAAVRGLITERNDEKRGWVWSTPIPLTLDILMDGRRVIGLEFIDSPDNEAAINGILFALGLVKRYQNLPRLFLREEDVELEDGQVVARFPDIEGIADPFLWIVQKLKMNMRR